MKNQIAKYTVLGLFILMIAPAGAAAQVATVSQQPLISQYVENDAVTEKKSWWNLLGRQLTHSIDKPYTEVSVAEMQNIIFFASNYKNKVKLNDANAPLLDVLNNHPDPQYRLMAVSAINAIGQRSAMIAMKRAADNEASPLVKRVAMVAVNKYFAIK
ncbi:MAG: HEAT repeat domain-containing protein [Bacteroidota bacterium]